MHNTYRLHLGNAVGPAVLWATGEPVFRNYLLDSSENRTEREGVCPPILLVPSLLTSSPLAVAPRPRLLLRATRSIPASAKASLCLKTGPAARVTSSHTSSATNTLYHVTSTPNIDDTLNDVSVLSNGDIRVVWSSLESDNNVYATTFTPAGVHYDICPLYDSTVAKKSGSAYPIKIHLFNLSTKGYSTGTYNLNFTAGADPATHSSGFAAK